MTFAAEEGRNRRDANIFVFTEVERRPRHCRSGKLLFSSVNPSGIVK